MNTKINLTYNDVNYTLEFDRMTVKLLENVGFKMDEFTDKPMNNVELVFKVAFVKNHPKLQSNIIDEIFNKCPNKTELVATLGAMIKETYDSLLADPEEGSEGNATWEMVSLAPKTQK